ncbi:MAG: SET domain-containing protein [bacterium]|nr:SET domain-containing protein [bacterium]
MPLAKQKTINILKNTYCRLRPSKISGVGVFAIRDIPPETNLFRGQNNERWQTFKMSELEILDKDVLKMIDDFFVIEKDGTVRIPKSGLNGVDVSFYVNHSEKPNAKTIDGGFSFKSLRKINKGEEITASYAAYDYKYKNKK